MKRYFYFSLIILSVLTALTGCGGSDDPDLPIVPPVVDKGLIPLASADSWFEQAEAQQSLGYDPQVMLVIFSLDNLPVGCSIDDVVGAFVDNKCRYALSVQTYEGKMYGSIVMYRIDSDGSDPLTFNIRYYSQKEKGYLVSTPVSFEADGTLGSFSKPIHLSWITK